MLRYVVHSQQSAERREVHGRLSLDVDWLQFAGLGKAPSVRTYVRKYVRIYVRTYVRKYVRTYVRTYMLIMGCLPSLWEHTQLRSTTKPEPMSRDRNVTTFSLRLSQT